MSFRIAISVVLLLGVGCHPATHSQASSASASPTASPPAPTKPTVITVPVKLMGGSGAVDGKWVAWHSSTTSYGLDHDAVWLSRPGWRRPRLVKAFPKGDLGAGVGLNYPYVTWVEYRETGNTSGPWTISLYNAESRRTSVIARWNDSGVDKDQPIPLPDLDPAKLIIVWHQLQQRSGQRLFCIDEYDIEQKKTTALSCEKSEVTYPHFAHVNEARVAYIVNTAKRGPQGSVSMPRSPDYPDLTALFEDGGELADWNLYTRETEADASGVAWIAESTKYRGGAQILYWEPGAPVKSFATRSSRYPASQVELVDGAVVWQEPDRVNDALVVRRSLLGCESAVVHLAQPWFNRNKKRHATNYLLEGASRDEILVGVVRSTSKPPFLLPFKLAIFPIPALPTECSDP